MSPRYNPLIFSGLDLTGGGPAGAVQWKSPVATESTLPMADNSPGDVRVALDTDKIYLWDNTTSRWIDTELTAAAFGATPNADGFTLSSTNDTNNSVNLIRTQINLEPADGTNPGAVSTTTQTFGGDKTFSGEILADGGIDSSTGTLNIATTGATATTINIGAPGSTVKIQGTTLYEEVTELVVEDKTITLNATEAGSSPLSGGAGIQVKELTDPDAGYVKISSDRDSWELKAPNTAGVGVITPGAAGITLDQSSHDPLTLTVVGSTPSAEGASLSSQALTLQPADATHPGVISTTTQSLSGQKTFTDDVTVSTGKKINVEQVTNLLGIDLKAGTTSGLLIRNESSNQIATIKYDPVAPSGAIVESSKITLDSDNITIGQSTSSVTIDAISNPQIKYTPVDSADWNSPTVSKVNTALDELAARFVGQNDATNEPTGFLNRTTSTLTFTDGGLTPREFKISPISLSTPFTFYVKGKKFEKSLEETIQISNTLGDHYIYYDNNGVLQETIDPDFVKTIIQEYAFVAVVYWNTETSSHTYFADERHGLTMDGVTHGYLHTVFGSRYLSGFALQNFTLVDNSPALPGPKFDADIGSFRDEDILHTVESITTQIPILYRFGLNNGWRKKAADTYPVIYQGSTTDYPAGSPKRLPYNEFTGVAWQLTEVDNTKYVLVHVFATNDIENPIVGIQGTAPHESISDAKNAANTEITQLSGLPFTEFVPLGSVLFQTADAKPGVTYSDIQLVDGDNYIDFRGTQLYTPAGTATTHSLLSGLGNDDHVQYLLADGTRTMGGALDMGTHKITNVVDPTSPQEASTKAYTDSKVEDTIVNGVTTKAPSQNAVYDALALKQDVGNYITALTTDVSASGPGSAVATIQPNVVTNSKLAKMAATTIKGNSTGVSADPQDLSASDVRTLISVIPDHSGDIARKTVMLAFGGPSTTPISGLLFSTATVRGFDVQLVVQGSSSFADYSIKGVQKSGSWELTQDYVGDDVGLTFSIDAGGQVYCSAAGAGSFTILFRAFTV